MKHLLSWKSVAVCTGMLAVLAAPAVAQPATFRVDVPFAFTVANHELPAGLYRFEVEVGRMLVWITQMDGRDQMLTRLVAGGSDRREKELNSGVLRFHRYGNRYLLSDIWRPGSAQGNAVTPSRVPKELRGAGVPRDVKATR